MFINSWIIQVMKLAYIQNFNNITSVIWMKKSFSYDTPTSNSIFKQLGIIEKLLSGALISLYIAIIL